MQDLIGRTLGHYRIVDKIGEGGMGEVYRAHDESLDRDVAVKVIHEEVARNPDRLTRLEREAKAVAKLSHQNILEIFDFGREDGVSFAVTEFLEGETLREHLFTIDGPLPWRQVREIGAAVANGLSVAHGSGVVHRDIKPSNIFLCSDGRVKILDFGLAATHEAVDPEAETGSIEAPLTHYGTVMGTVGYMAPEQVRGEPADSRADIFALGCVLYEMLTGQRAFKRDTTAEIMTAILREDPADISASGEYLPPELIGTVRRCLEKRPESRFQSASDLAYNLRSLSPASSASPTRSTRRLAGWRKVAPWLSLAAVVVVALVWLNPGGWRHNLFASGDSVASGTIDSLAVLPFVNIGGDEDIEYLSDGIPASVIYRLSKLSALRVVPRSTAFRFREQGQDLADIGRLLNARAILIGEIRAQAETLVIRVELVDVNTDRQLWGERLTGTLDDILATEERIANSVSEALRVELSGEDRAQLARGGTSSPEAHRHFLRGRYLLDGRTREHLREAVASFSRAVAEDPDFALAYCGLAESWIMLADWAWEPPRNVLPQAKRAAEQALALDHSLAEAHAALAYVSEYEWDPVTADREYRRALELNPGSVEARYGWAWFLALQGRFDEAIVEARRALEMNPVHRGLTVALVVFLHSARQTEDAMDHVQQALEMDPGNVRLYQLRGRILAAKGRFEEAVSELEQPNEFKQNRLKYLGWAYGRAGRIDEARAVLAQFDEFSREGYVSPGMIALVYAGMGDNDQAFALLERGLAERDVELIYLKQMPEWDPIRDDPRFADVISRIPYFIED